MRKYQLIAGLALCLATTAEAQAFRAENGVRVTPAAGGFEVLGDAGWGARGRWCAAADYAQRVLGARSADRVYVAQGRVPGLGQRSPVLFTLDPTGLQPRSVLLVGSSLTQAGYTLSAGHAYRFCADARISNR